MSVHHETTMFMDKEDSWKPLTKCVHYHVVKAEICQHVRILDLLSRQYVETARSTRHPSAWHASIAIAQ